jgi:plastocyanin
MPPAVRILLATIAVLFAVPSAALAASTTVTIAGKAFGPADVQVAPGDSVTWNWTSGPHNVHVISGPETFDSGIKDAGGTYTRAMTAAGTYTYQCDVHPSMRGTVVVGAPSAGAPAGPAGAAPVTLSRVRVSTLAVVHLSSSSSGTLAIRLVRGGRVARRAQARIAAGSNRLPLAVRGLPRGRYQVHLQATDAAGQRSAPLVRSVLVGPAALARRPAPAPSAPAPAAGPAPAPPVADDHGHHPGGHGRGRDDHRRSAPRA